MNFFVPDPGFRKAPPVGFRNVLQDIFHGRAKLHLFVTTTLPEKKMEKIMLTGPLRISSFLCLVLLLGACNKEDAPAVPAADRVFLNGGVYTVDDQHSWAEAVAINDDTIVFVGSNEDVQAFIGDTTEVTDLSGKMLLPGFIDGHAHVLSAGSSLNSCHLQESNDPAVIHALLMECRETRGYGPDDWVIGGQWQLSAFGPDGPTRQVLDEIFEGRPAYFTDAFGHNAWVSTRALELAGINANTADPAGGVIVRDPVTAEATGTLRESAMDLVSDIIPPGSAEQDAISLATGLAEVARFGITAYIEPGLADGDAATYLEADRNDTLSARVMIALSPLGSSATAFDDAVFDLLERRGEYRGKYLNADAVKVFMDGVIETKTSNMLEPYSDDLSNFDNFYTPEAAHSFYEKLDAMGVQIHTHAIGDGAIRAALDAYEYALQQNGPNDNRHVITHLQLIDEADIPRFGQLNVAANFQSLWAYPDQYIELAVSVVGQDRVDHFYPIASVARTGGVLTGGSDWNVTSLNPLDAIETAVRRQDPWSSEGRIHNESERVDLATMIDAYTRNGAWLMRLEDQTGSIEPGKRADLIVLDRKLFEIPAEEINESKVLLTLMDGKEVYRAE
jgi:predicted amidohydrolase YtcJ